LSDPAIGYFWGDDEYGLERAADRIAQRLAETGGVAPERHRLTGAEVTSARLEELVATAPLFGGGTLVVVTEPGPLARSAEGRQAITGMLERVAPGNGIVFLDATEGSRRKGDRRPALAEVVLGVGGEIGESRAPTEGRFAAWIEHRAADLGLRLERGASQELARRVGGLVREGDVDRRRMGLMAVAELEKLALLHAADGAGAGAPDGVATGPDGTATPGDEVSIDDVRALVPEAVPASGWAFLDAVARRPGGRAAAGHARCDPAARARGDAPSAAPRAHRRRRSAGRRCQCRIPGPGSASEPVSSRGPRRPGASLDGT
jgi:hypothetical protein